MEPKYSSPEVAPQGSGSSPESLPQIPNPETTPEAPVWTPEQGQSSGAERAPEHAAQAQASMAAQAASPVTLPTPVPIANDDAAQAAADDTPAVAADEDLIEKEWVDKAKKIITDTRDDPAAREKQVGRLQADYLKKRYGKELGAAD
jgi:hypothetical protein